MKLMYWFQYIQFKLWASNFLSNLNGKFQIIEAYNICNKFGKEGKIWECHRLVWNGQGKHPLTGWLALSMSWVG